MNNHERASTMHTINKTDLPTLGTPLAGGFYAGLYQINEELQALILAPKKGGELSGAWGDYGKEIPGASSWNDGRANTLDMAEAGSELAIAIRALQINGFDDWYLPALDELELCYRAFKPTKETNWLYLYGTNLSAVPQTRPYTPELPEKTTIKVFSGKGKEAFQDTWYWTSTQYYAHCAWYQNFDDGNQNFNYKHYKYCARAVRRLLVIE